MHATTAPLAVVLMLVAASTARADTPASAVVGEIRTLIVNRADPAQIEELHREGWIEARGEVLSATAFSELFRAIGRRWTLKRVKAGEFAVPFLDDPEQPDPSGVLGPGDIVTGGSVHPHRHVVSHWIFAGRDVNGYPQTNWSGPARGTQAP